VRHHGGLDCHHVQREQQPKKHFLGQQASASVVSCPQYGKERERGGPIYFLPPSRAEKVVEAKDARGRLTAAGGFLAVWLATPMREKGGESDSLNGGPQY